MVANRTNVSAALSLGRFCMDGWSHYPVETALCPQKVVTEKCQSPECKHERALLSPPISCRRDGQGLLLSASTCRVLCL